MRPIRTTQPAGFAQIDWANPITRGLTLAYIPTVPTKHLATGGQAKPNSVAGITYQLGEKGRAFTPNGATNDGVGIFAEGGVAYRPITSNTDCTIAVLAAPANTATRKIGFSQRYGSGNVEQINLMWGLNSAFSVLGGYVCFFARNNAGAAGYADNSTAALDGPDGSVHLWGGSQAANVPNIWKDGKLIGDRQVNSSGTLVTTNQATRLGNVADYAVDGIYASAVPMFLTLVWGARALTQREWTQLARNPWQVFAPLPNRVHFPSVAAGAVTIRQRRTLGQRVGSRQAA